jgi:hypothetical protein
MLGGEAVAPLRGAFGGWTLYVADLFRQQGLEACRYSALQHNMECEQVPLHNCLSDQRSSWHIIASRLLITWEGCSGPVIA